MTETIIVSPRWRMPLFKQVHASCRLGDVAIVRPAPDDGLNEFSHVFDADSFAITLTGRSLVRYERFAGTLSGPCTAMPGQAISCQKGLDVVSASQFSDMSVLTIGFDRERVAEYVSSNIVMPPFRPASQRTPSEDLLRLGVRIAQELHASEQMRSLAIEALSLQLLVGMFRYFDRIALAREDAHRGGLAGWQISRVRELLARDLAADISLIELASAVNLSVFHFARQFKRSVGVPPHAYLVQLRVERAKQLLATTDLPITEISAQVGYEDPGYLARIFRKSVGAAPAAYRKDRRS